MKINVDSAAECPGIGLYAETSLHSAVKAALTAPGDRQEVRVFGKIVDILKADGEIVEVQTGNFGKLKDKIPRLLEGGHRVRVVYPVPTKRYIIKIDPVDGHELSRRRSPKKGSILNIFDELIHYSDLLALPSVSLEALLIEVEEIRCADGKGSWRKRFISTLDRRMTFQGESRLFSSPADLLDLLPAGLPEEFSSSELAQSLSCKTDLARRILYCLRAVGLAEEKGKKGRAILWSLVKPTPKKKKRSK